MLLWSALQARHSFFHPIGTLGYLVDYGLNVCAILLATTLYSNNPLLLCIFLVIPSYWGYWQLGRKVTLGPVEIAHAFRSPMTAPPADNPAAVAKTNGTIQELMEEVGDRKVQYGQIVDGEAKGILGVAEPEHVERVHPKIGVAKGEIKELFRTHSTKK